MWWLTCQDSPGSTESSQLTTAGGAAVAGAELSCRSPHCRTCRPVVLRGKTGNTKVRCSEDCHCRAPPVLYFTSLYIRTTQQHTSYQLPAISYQLTDINANDKLSSFREVSSCNANVSVYSKVMFHCLNIDMDITPIVTVRLMVVDAEFTFHQSSEIDSFSIFYFYSKVQKHLSQVRSSEGWVHRTDKLYCQP